MGDLVSGCFFQAEYGKRGGTVTGVQTCALPIYGHEKSDPAIVAVKPANKAKKSTAEASAGKVAAEPGERRAGTKGNAGQQSTCRAQNRISVSQALERIRQFAVTHPRWEPYAGKPHVRFCAGGVR